MNFVPMAAIMRRARSNTELWNFECPDRAVPWEWVEECVLHWRYWKENLSYDPVKAEEHEDMHIEFARFIPRPLLEMIFP